MSRFTTSHQRISYFEQVLLGLQVLGAELDLDTFCTYYELQCQPKKVGDNELIA
jgi:hypothetical protein